VHFLIFSTNVNSSTQHNKPYQFLTLTTSCKKYITMSFTRWSCLRDSYLLLLIIMGTAVAQWLSGCATKRKVAGSIPAGVSGIFH